MGKRGDAFRSEVGVVGFIPRVFIGYASIDLLVLMLGFSLFPFIIRIGTKVKTHQTLYFLLLFGLSL